MAKPNYAFEKRQREMEKKKKKAEKANKKQTGGPDTGPDAGPDEGTDNAPAVSGQEAAAATPPADTAGAPAAG